MLKKLFLFLLPFPKWVKLCAPTLWIIYRSIPKEVKERFICEILWAVKEYLSKEDITIITKVLNSHVKEVHKQLPKWSKLSSKPIRGH